MTSFLYRHEHVEARLAIVAGASAVAQGVSIEDLRGWIAGLGPSGWRREFEASPIEVADLLQYVHDPDVAMSASLLEGETIEIQVDPENAPHSANTELALVLAPSEQERPRPLLLLASIGQFVARIRAAGYRHLLVLCNAVFQLSARPTAWNAEGFVTHVALKVILD